MIKYLITGGCSFSNGGNGYGWTGHLTKELQSLNPALVTDHTGEISQGQELIQKKVVIAIINALTKGYDPSEIFVATMWSGVSRKAWYIDSKDMIGRIVEGWKSYSSGCGDQFVSLSFYKNQQMKSGKIYYTAVSHASYDECGGWYYTQNGSDSGVDGIREHFLLDKHTNGLGAVHNSLENIVFLQNFCKSHKIKIVNQTYMDEVFKSIDYYKTHQINDYLYKQLDLNSFITSGMFEFVISKYQHSLQEWSSLDYNKKEQVKKDYGINLLQTDNYHPNDLGAGLYFNEILKPVVNKIFASNEG